MTDLEDVPPDVVTEAIIAQFDPNDLVELLNLSTDKILFYCWDEVQKRLDEGDEDLRMAVEEHYTMQGGE